MGKDKKERLKINSSFNLNIGKILSENKQNFSNKTEQIKRGTISVEKEKKSTKDNYNY